MSVSYKVTVSIANSIVTAKDPAGSTISSGSAGASASIIQAAVNSVKKNGSGILHMSEGIFPCSNRIDISGINDFVLEGEGRTATVLKVAAAGFNLIVKSGSAQTKNTVIRNIGLDGNNVSAKLLDFGNCLNLLIDNVVFERHNNPVPSAYIVNLEDSTIRNCIIRNNNDVGDAMAVAGNGVKILNNEFYGKSARITSGAMQGCEFANNYFHDVTGYAAISLENYGSFKNITIRNNRFERIEKNAVLTLGYGGDGIGTFDTIIIHDNTFSEIGGAAIKINAFSDKPNQITYNASIYNNTISNTHYNGMYLGPMKNAKISLNSIANTTGYGIRLYKTSDAVSIDNNHIENAELERYYFAGSTNVSINGIKVA